MARADRLAALGVTPGAPVEVLQTFPGFVFRCDETELAVEPAVAHAILVESESGDLGYPAWTDMTGTALRPAHGDRTRSRT